MSVLWRNQWPRTAFCVWFFGLLGVGIEGYLQPNGHTVFDIYRVASLQWWEGQDMYPRQVETGEIYRYSPTFAIVTSPFAFVSPGLGNAAWKVFNGLAMVLGLWVMAKRICDRPTPNQVSWFFLLAAPLAMLSLYIGQANLLTMALMVGCIVAVAEDRWWIATFCLTAATLTKVFPLPLAFVLGAVYWRQFPLRFLAAMAVGLIFPFAFQRPAVVERQYRSWLTHIAESDGIHRERLKSLDKLFEICGWLAEPRTLHLFAALGGLLVLLSFVYFLRVTDRRTALLRLLYWFVPWGLLYNPACENATFSILAPVLAWAIVDEFRRPTPWVSRIVLVLVLLMTGPSTTEFITPEGARLSSRYAIPTIGALLFQFWLFADAYRFRRRAGLKPGRFP